MGMVTSSVGSSPESFVDRLLEIVFGVFLSAGVGALMFPNYIPRAVLSSFVLAVAAAIVRNHGARSKLGDRFGYTLQEVASNAWVWSGIVAIIWVSFLTWTIVQTAYRPSAIISTPGSTNTATASDWPPLSDDDVRDLGKKLAPFHPRYVELSYGDEKDKPIAVSFAQAMFAANWPDAGVGMSGTIIGINIEGTDDSRPAMNVLRDFCKAKLGIEPRIVTGGDASHIAMMIGSKPLP
jgi:hypothetical protein